MSKPAHFVPHNHLEASLPPHGDTDQMLWWRVANIVWSSSGVNWSCSHFEVSGLGAPVTKFCAEGQPAI